MNGTLQVYRGCNILETLILGQKHRAVVYSNLGFEVWILLSPARLGSWLLSGIQVENSTTLVWNLSLSTLRRPNYPLPSFFE